MKRLIFFIAILLVSSVLVKAQMNSGSKFLAGNNSLSVQSYTDKDKDFDVDPDKYFNLNLTTKAGYFLKNRIAIGGMIDYGYARRNFVTSQYKYTDISWMIGPLARYYMEYGTLVPFFEASAGFGVTVNKQEPFDSTPFESKHSVFGLKGGVGADYFLNESIAFEGMINYFMNSQKPSGDGATGAGSVRNGVQVNFGVIFYFGTI